MSATNMRVYNKVNTCAWRALFHVCDDDVRHEHPCPRWWKVCSPRTIVFTVVNTYVRHKHIVPQPVVSLVFPIALFAPPPSVASPCRCSA